MVHQSDPPRLARPCDLFREKSGALPPRAEYHVRTAAGVSTAPRAHLDADPSRRSSLCEGDENGIAEAGVTAHPGSGSIFPSMSLRVWPI